MAENFLQVNQDQTEVLIIGPEAQREKVDAVTLKPCQQEKKLRVLFDSNLSFEAHIRNMIKPGCYHLNKISRVRLFLSQTNTETLMLLFPAQLIPVTLHFLLFLTKTLFTYSLLQNSAARVLMRSTKRHTLHQV